MGLSPFEIAAKEDFQAAANPIVAAGISLTRNVLRSIISPPDIQRCKGRAYDGALPGKCQAPHGKAGSSNRHIDHADQMFSAEPEGPGAVDNTRVPSRALSTGT